MKTPIVVFGLGVLGATACIDTSVSHPAVSVTDSAGIRIVTNASPRWSADEAWRVANDPLVTIGRVDGTDVQQLYRVAGALRLADGRIVIANAGTHELRFYEADGQFRNRVGTEGEGPGEFRSIYNLHRFAGDSVVIVDLSLRRLTVFDREGELGRTISIRSGTGTSTRPLGTFADGQILVAEVVVDGPPPGGRTRVQRTLRMYDADGTAGDSVGVDYSVESFIQVEGQYFRVLPAPFARAEVTTVHAAGAVLSPLDDYTLWLMSTTGAIEQIVRRTDSMHGVTPELFAAELARITAPYSPTGRPPSVEEQLREAGMPETMPPFGPNTRSTFPQHTGILIDNVGNLWVQEYPGPAGAADKWSVFNQADVWLGGVTFPPGVMPVDIGAEEVLGHWRDDLDVEYVGLFALTKPS